MLHKTQKTKQPNHAKPRAQHKKTAKKSAPHAKSQQQQRSITTSTKMAQSHKTMTTKTTSVLRQQKRTIVHNLESADAAADFVTGQGDKLVLLKFSAEWCGPCRILKPKFEVMSNEYPNVTFAAVDADEFISVDINESWPAVSALPTTLAIKNNKCVGTVLGVDLPAIENIIKANAV